MCPDVHSRLPPIFELGYAIPFPRYLVGRSGSISLNALGVFSGAFVARSEGQAGLVITRAKPRQDLPLIGFGKLARAGRRARGERRPGHL